MSLKSVFGDKLSKLKNHIGSNIFQTDDSEVVDGGGGGGGGSRGPRLSEVVLVCTHCAHAQTVCRQFLLSWIHAQGFYFRAQGFRCSLV